jgi:hypothetical protein
MNIERHLTDFEHLIHETEYEDNCKQLFLIGNLLKNEFQLVIIKNGTDIAKYVLDNR